jgi:DNA repair exonuclease SbcCD ATPase subunit
LKQKENLLAELEKWEPKEDSNPLKELKEFSKKWRNIGFVPIDKKDEINAKYKELLDSKYEAMDIDKAERKKLKLEEKIESLKDSSKGDYILRKEQDHIRNRINKLENDIIQFENNMGFLAQSKGAEQLKEEVQRKIEKARQEIEALQEQAQMLKNA